MKKDKNITPIALVIIVALFPYYFLFFRNIGKIRFTETLTVLSILIAASLLLLALITLFVKDLNKSALITSGLSVFLLYFEKIVKALKSLLPFLYYWHVLIIGISFILLLSVLISRRLSRTNAVKICNSILFVVIGLFVFNIALSIPNLQKALLSPKGESPATAIGAEPDNRAQENVIRPNVYFFIFDEYGGPSNLQRYCEYDNTPFYDTMESMGFVSSRNSKNDTGDTTIEVPNLLQLSRVNKLDMTALQKWENFKKPLLMTMMKDNGYSINLLDSKNYQFLDVSLSDYHLTSNFTTSYRTFDSYIWENSFIYPFYGKQDQNKERAGMLRMFAYAAESPKLQSTNLFTIGYFGFPHIPYIFDENGNKTNSSDRTNLKDPQPYLDQLLYANKLISKTVTEIIDADPLSIIIIQSDHGLRLASHLHYWYGIRTYDLNQEAEYEHDILNLVYYPSEKLDIEGLNGLATLKKVLSHLLAIELD